MIKYTISGFADEISPKLDIQIATLKEIGINHIELRSVNEKNIGDFSLLFAKRIKKTAFNLSRKLWPNAKLFGLTSGGAVMKINTELGYVPVPFSELTDDEAFWRGCQGCCNHDVLERTERRYCICTGMLYDPAKHKDKE